MNVNKSKLIWSIYSIVAIGFIIFLGSYLTTILKSGYLKDKSNIHEIHYFIDTLSGNFGDIVVFEKELKEDISILNNLCEKLNIVHRFEFRKLQHLGLRNGKKIRAYFLENEELWTDRINVYLSPRDNNYGTDWQSPFFSGNGYRPHDDKCKDGAYGKGNFIHLPFNYKHEVATLLHEITHKFVSGGDIHIDNSHKWEDCELTKSNSCVNLMGQNYSVPFSFLLTSSQRENINNKSRCSPCTSEHLFPKDVVGEKIESDIECCPDLKFDVDESMIREMIQNITEDDILLVLHTLEVMLANSICPSQIDGQELDRLVQLIIKESICEKLNDSLNDIICGEPDVFRIKRAIVIVSRIFRQLYLSSDFYEKFTKNESTYLSNRNAILAKNYLRKKNDFVQSIFNEVQEDMEKELIRDLAQSIEDDDLILDDLRDSILTMEKILAQQREEIGILKYRGEQYEKEKILLVNYDLFLESIHRERKLFFKNKRTLVNLNLRLSGILYRVELRENYNIDSEDDFAYNYRQMETKLGA